LGFLARNGAVTEDRLRQATVVGGVMASFCVEEFSLDGIRELTEEQIADRFDKFEQLVDFGTLDLLGNGE
ncbi:MAG: sugar kinase, partial [Bradymonadaceae bacterium]